MNPIIQAINSVTIDSKSVIVYDIDGTLIENDQPIHYVVESYHYAVKKGLKPVIITARKSYPENISYTINQLKQYNIVSPLIFFLPVHLNDQAMFKLNARKSLHHDRGYEVKISVGDMPWDIGQYGGIGIRV
ncbi:MAG: HAD hydrolase family protein [Verrucomicrobia bacterium]|nr:HAD hydrolase family protein [Verrucomicrobiota bacterium]